MVEEQEAILADLRVYSRTLGFSHLGISGIDLSEAEPRLQAWLDRGFHGAMHFMAKHGMKRARPSELVPGTLSVITVRFPYLVVDKAQSLLQLEADQQAYIARYALGEDYHVVVKDRLKQLVEYLQMRVGSFGYRVFTDSAPVLEVEIAQQAGLGWRGKHTLLVSRDQGSFFFLGEIFTDLPLLPTAKASAHCGSCQRCMVACPTQAIVDPYTLDARRCIAYLTIELKDSIPVEFRQQIGNRIYGCDDCQWVCPWNKYAIQSNEMRLYSRNNLESVSLLTLWGWTEDNFATYLKKSPIFRIGYLYWRRNLAVGLGNAHFSRMIVRALVSGYLETESLMLREHIAWALDQQLDKQSIGKAE